jgi:peptidoglycan/LPS O-acetylase OafA/YrhL
MNGLQDNRIIPQLTGLRAIAAFMVFLHHSGSAELPFLVQRLLAPMYIGVNIFFVLSGFLIFYRYQDGFILNVAWLKPYLKKRFARIYPMYFLLTTATFIYFYYWNIDISDLMKIYILNITFLKGFLSQLVYSGIPQGWSLTVEECFYLSAPFLFLLRKKIPLYVQAALLILLGLMLVYVLGTQQYYGFFSDYNFMLNFTFFGRIIDFMAGGALAVYVSKSTPNGVRKNFYTWFGLFFIIVGMALIS